MATVWDLSRLIYTVRKLTGKYDLTQLPDGPSSGEVNFSNPPGICDYINDFYLYDFPEHLRTLKLKDFFTFTTIPNVGTYNVPMNIVDLEPPLYIDNYQFAYYQSPDIFYRIWPEFNNIDQAIATGNGSKTIFTFTVTQQPVQQGTVVIGMQPNQDGNPSPQLETFTDSDTPALLDQPTQIKFTNPGTLLSNLYTGVIPPASPGVTPGTGTIDYLTGATTVSFTIAPPAGININAHYHPYVASRPRDLMFFQQQLFLRPIPNDTYFVKLLAYFQPTVAISNLTNAATKAAFDGTLTDQSLFLEWWQLLAYGAAIKILVEDGDHEEAGRLKPIFEEQKLLAQRKALKQLANQRINTPYGDNAGAAGPQFPVFPLY